jgi:hypothetical protein
MTTSPLKRSEFAEMVLKPNMAREYIHKGKDTFETATELQNLAFTYPQKYTSEFGLEPHHYATFYQLLEEFGCPPLFAEVVNYMTCDELERVLYNDEFHLVDEDQTLIMSTSMACCSEKSDTDDMRKRTLLHCYGIQTAYYKINMDTCCRVISNNWYETPELRYKCTKRCTHPPGLQHRSVENVV